MAYTKNPLPHRCACGETDPTQFYGTRKTKCKTCVKPEITAYARAHPEMRRISRQAWVKANPRANRECQNRGRNRRYAKLRLEILKHYSGSHPCCNCCGEERLPFLALDHIAGQGNQHKKLVGRGEAFYRWIQKTQYPPIFQVLCHNCNLAKGFYGQCPHKGATTRTPISKSSEYTSKYYQKLRLRVLEHYGKDCSCCGETEVKFLALDHTTGGGCQERRSLGYSGSGFYRWVILNHFPNHLRTLCHNCNLSTGFLNRCPHLEEITYGDATGDVDAGARI